jgi:putative ABC transport system permease protein
MNLRWVWMAHLRGLRQRWTRTLLAVLAVGAGAAMLVGVQISNRSINNSLSQFNDSVSFGAAFHIEGPADHGTVDQSILPAVAATPGVKTAIPLVMTVAQATDARGHQLLVPAIGIDCSIEAIVGSFGCDPAAMAQTTSDAPAVGPALQKRLGPTGALHTNLGDIAGTSTFALKQLNRINRGLVAVFPLASSQRQFTRPNGLDVILVLPQKGTDPKALQAALQRAAGPQNHVYDAKTPLGGPEGIASATSVITPFLFLISLIGVVIGAQLVRNSVDLSLEERRRDFATSSALGATPRDVVIGLVSESVVVGVLGSILAVIGGQLIATAFIGTLSSEIAKHTGLRSGITTPPSAIVLGVIVVLGVSVLASLPPARRASRLDLVAELSGRQRFVDDKAGSRRGLIINGAILAVLMVLGFVAHRGGALESWQPNATLLALVGSMVCGYVLCVQLAPRLLIMLQRAPGFSTGPGRIALTNIVRARRRTVAVALAITAPVFFSVILGGVAPGMGAAARTLAGDSNDSVFVSTLPSNNSSGIDSKVTPGMEAALLAVPGAARIERGYFASFNDPQSTWFAVDGFTGTVPHFHVHRGGTAEEVFGRGEVMIGPGLARTLHLGVGDTMTLPARIGPRQSFTVGGIWASPDNLGRSVTMPADKLLALTGPRPSGNITVIAAPGVTAAELEARIFAAHISPRLRVMTTDQLADDFTKEFLALASPFDALRFSLVAVALVATASTLVLAAVQRRRDNAILAAVGMAPSDLARSTLIETVITALVVAFVATLCGQFGLINFTWASATLTGLAIPYRFAPGPVLTASLAVTVIALVGAALPAWRTARTDVMEALRTA